MEQTKLRGRPQTRQRLLDAELSVYGFDGGVQEYVRRKVALGWSMGAVSDGLCKLTGIDVPVGTLRHWRRQWAASREAGSRN